MAAITLSRAEYLVLLDILHVDQILGLENVSLIPADRDEHLELIMQGVRWLEERGLVRVEEGRHTIERRLLELVVVAARPRLLFRTIRDKADVGPQLYLHYYSGNRVVEQVLPDEDHFTLGQLPDLASAMDRIIRLLDIPVEFCEYAAPRLIEREALNKLIGLYENDDIGGARAVLTQSGWASNRANRYLSSLADKKATNVVYLIPVVKGRPGEALDLTIVQDDETAWLLKSQPRIHDRIFVYQVNAASFRESLEESYNIVLERTLEGF